MNRIALFCTGLLLMCSLSGCCLLGGCGSSCGPCGPCGGGYGAAYPYSGGGCPGGACGAAAPGYPTALNSGYTTAYAPGATTTAMGVDPVTTF